MSSVLAANKLVNLRRRVNRARKFPDNTCPASRHLHIIAEALATGRPYPMLQEEAEHCAGTMLSVLESLWKLRTRTTRERSELLAAAAPSKARRDGTEV